MVGWHGLGHRFVDADRRSRGACRRPHRESDLGGGDRRGSLLADRVSRRWGACSPTAFPGVRPSSSATCSPASSPSSSPSSSPARQDSPGILTLLVTIQGAVSAVIGPFQQAILPDLVPPSEFLAAVSLNSAQVHLGESSGPRSQGSRSRPSATGRLRRQRRVLPRRRRGALLRPCPRSSPGSTPSRSGCLLRSGRARAAGAEPGCRAAIGTIAVVALLASPFIALVSGDGASPDRLPACGSYIGDRLSRPPRASAPSPGRWPSPLSLAFWEGAGCSRPASRLPLVLAFTVSPFVGAFAVGSARSSRWDSCTSACRPACRQSCSFGRRSALRGRVLGLYLVVWPVSGIRSVPFVQGPLVDSLGLAWTTPDQRSPAGGSRCDVVLRPGVFRGARLPGIDIDVSSPVALFLPTDVLLVMPIKAVLRRTSWC